MFAGKDEVTLVLTAEASGIALATDLRAGLSACRWCSPRRPRATTSRAASIRATFYSYTYKKKVTLLVSKEWLSASDDKVLIIDDFMAQR